MTPIHAIQELITVYDYDMLPTGISISYDYQGVEKHLICDPDQSAELLEKAGIVDKVKIRDGELVMKVEFEYFDYERVLWIGFDEYAEHFKLSQLQAVMLVATHEKEMRYKQIYDFKNIPDIIKNAI